MEGELLKIIAVVVGAGGISFGANFAGGKWRVRAAILEITNNLNGSIRELRVALEAEGKLRDAEDKRIHHRVTECRTEHKHQLKTCQMHRDQLNDARKEG